MWSAEILRANMVEAHPGEPEASVAAVLPKSDLQAQV